MTTFSLTEVFIVPKLSYLFILVILLTACKPVQEQGVDNNLIATQCITSQSDCQIATKLGNVSVKFAQHQLTDKVKTELPFIMELTVLPEKEAEVKQPSITKVSAYLEGRDMFMGKVPVFFQASEGGSSYQAESLLANCTEEQMVWRLWVTVEALEQQQTFFVDFTSVRL